MQTMSRLADNLRHARRNAGLSQLELAKRTGVGAATIARLETGTIDNPRVKTLQALAEALGVNARDLLPDE